MNGSATVTEETVENYIHRGDFSEEFCANPDVVVTPVETSTGPRILQRCVRKGNFGCEVYGNLSLQVFLLVPLPDSLSNRRKQASSDVLTRSEIETGPLTEGL